ncbi:MAG TPA: TonB-dependent receptor, partial [Segetibacter sp.]
MKFIYAYSFLRRLALLLFVSLVGIAAFTQPKGKATVKGKTSDSLSVAPLAFSTIKVFNSINKKPAGESIANEAGEFVLNLDFGEYYAVADYMGYKSFKTAAFSVSKEHAAHDLGVI